MSAAKESEKTYLATGTNRDTRCPTPAWRTAGGGDYQYRIKSADEPFDRVVKESELETAM